jgi:hypothetical protein
MKQHFFGQVVVPENLINGLCVFAILLRVRQPLAVPLRLFTLQQCFYTG